MTPAGLRSLAYRSRLLPAWHSLSNRDTLTVVLFHRVLPIDDVTSRPRPPWIVSPAFFEQCLRFFQAHYRIVGFDAVLASAARRAPLPPRALLVTFDDGWADTAEFAAPILARLGIPALLFAVGRLGDGAELWQEPVVRLWLDSARPSGAWRDLWNTVLAPLPPPTTLSFLDLQRILAALDPLSDDRRRAALAPLHPEPPAPRAMLDAAMLQALAQRRFHIGAHGLSHLPLTLAADPGFELRQSRSRLEAMLGPAQPAVVSMSWPHGRCSPELTAAAFSAGYQVLFTSDAVLNPTRGGFCSNILGRFEPDMEYFADSKGNLRPDVLASHLFRLPRRRLTGQP